MSKIIRLTDKNGVVSNISVNGPGPHKIKADKGTKVAVIDEQTGSVVENVVIQDTGSDINLTIKDGAEQLTVVLQDGDGSGIAVFGSDGSAISESAAYTGDILVGDDGNDNTLLFGALGALAIGGGIALLGGGDKTPPMFTSNGTATPVAENIGAGKVIYTAAATDKSAVTYSIKAGAGDASQFSIDAKTGAVTLIGNPNFEAKSSYSFTVIATDAAGNASEQVVTLAVTNLDEVAPTFTSGTAATAIQDGTGANTVVYTATSTDTGDISTGSTAYSIKAGVGDAAKFSINAATGALTLLANADYDTKSQYSVTLVATDAAGNKSEQTVTLDVIYENIVTVTVVGGPVVATNALTVGLYDGTGHLLRTADLDDKGTVTVNLGSYRGPVIAVVLNDADNVADYLDEATGLGKDLSVDLYAMGALSGTNEVLSLNVNVLSTVAYYKAIAAAGADPFNGGELTTAVVNDTNKAVADLFGVQSLHDLTVAPINGDAYQPADGVSPSEKYGEVLAALSGADQNNGSTAATLNKLVAGITVDGSTASFDNPTYAMVNKGADTIDQTLNLSTLKSVANDTNPTILDAKIVSATGMMNGLIGTGDVVTVELRLSEPVDVTGSPQLKLNIGGQIVSASLASPQPKDGYLTFTYTVPAGLTDANGISIPADALALNGGTIASKDDGQSLITLNDAVADNASFPVDSVAPVITGPSNAAGAATSAKTVDENVTSVHTFTADDANATWSISGTDSALFTISSTGALSFKTGHLYSAPADSDANNQYVLTVTSTDSAGNASTQTVTVSVADLTPPVTGPIDISAGTDSGADDTLTNNGNPVLTFTGEAGLTIGLKGPDGTVLVKDTNYTVTYSGGTYTVTLLDAVAGGSANPFGTYASGSATGNPASTADGIYTITATDAASNSANVGTFTIDTTLPDVGALDMTNATDSGTSAEDEYTNNGHPVLTFTGEPGLTIGLEGPDGTPLEEGVNFKVEYANGTYTVTLLDAKTGGTNNDPFGSYAAGSSTGNPEATGDGVYTITATDAASNSVDVGTFTIDTTVTVGALDITNATDSGANDTVTDNGHPVLTFTGEEGLTIGLEGPDGTALEEGVNFKVEYANGTYTVTLLDAKTGGTSNDPFGDYASGSSTGNPAATADGIYTITATDKANNSADVGTFEIATSAVDTTPPAVGPLDMTNTTDSGASAEDELTNNGHPVLTFDGEPGLTIGLEGPDGTALVENTNYTVSYSAGVYTVTLLDAKSGGTASDPFGTYSSGSATGNPASTGDGTYTISATDAANNSVDVGTFVIDTTAPVAPVITDITEGTGDTTDNLISNDITQVVKVTGQAGCTVKVYASDGTLIPTTNYTVTETTAGNYTVDFGSNALASGDYAVKLTDAAGNESVASNAFTIQAVFGIVQVVYYNEYDDFKLAGDPLATQGSVTGSTFLIQFNGAVQYGPSATSPDAITWDFDGNNASSGGASYTVARSADVTGQASGLTDWLIFTEVNTQLNVIENNANFAGTIDDKIDFAQGVTKEIGTNALSAAAADVDIHYHWLITTAGGSFTGGSVSDWIIGNTGNETIYGRGGGDKLTGGAGSDTFKFDFGAASRDRITDFAAGSTGDKIDFVGTEDLTAASGDLKFIKTAATSGALSYGMNVLSGVTAATASTTDIAAALQNFSSSAGAAKFYIALNVTDLDSTTSGNQAGSVIVLYDNTQSNTALQSSELSVVTTLDGVTAGNLAVGNFVDFVL